MPKQYITCKTCDVQSFCQKTNTTKMATGLQVHYFLHYLNKIISTLKYITKTRHKQTKLHK